MAQMSLHITSGRSNIYNLNDLSKREKHNLRKFKKNVKQEGEFIDLIDRKGLGYTDYFKQELGSRIENALVDYNRNQRAGRKIKDVDEYIKKIEGSKNKKNLAVEMIVGVGDRQMWQEEPFKSDRKSIEKVFKDYVKYLQEYMPEFVLISATIHQDEDTPHCHIIGIPLYEGDKKGLSVKIAKGKVFTRDTLKAMQDDVRVLFEKGINENYKLDEPFKFGEKQTGRNWDYTVEEYKKLKENFNIANEIKELQELKSTLDNDVTLFYDSLEVLKNPFDYNHKNKIEKLENVKKTYKEINKKMDNIFLNTKEKAQFLQGKVDKIKLDDKTIEELEKNLTRKYKKELGDKIRGRFVDSDELKDFEKRVYEDYKKQIENKVVRQTTIKGELEKLELLREQLQKEFNEQFENHKRNVENWEKQKELEQEKIEKEHNDKLKKIEQEKLSLESLKEYCQKHDLYELGEQQRFLDTQMKLKKKIIDDMNKEIKTLEIKSYNIKNKLAQYTQEDNQKIADLKEYKEKNKELIENINKYEEQLGIARIKWIRRKKAVDNINDSVKNKNIELENIDKDIAEKSKKLEDINKNITNKTKQLEDVNNNISNKNLELKNVEKKLTEKDKELEEKEQNLQEKYQKKIEQFDKEYNYYEREYFYRLAIAERFIENLSKTLAKGSSLSEDEAKKLIEDNIDDRFVTDYFVEVDYSKKNNTKLDIKAILEDLNYTEPESKETVKNNYTSYYDDYDK
jgi:hypothetical protein